uniref:Uncharacterized protein n=1 Tax=Arundo donax TaxID=35708 RepID=A0A0A9DPK2_ARUDO
MSRKPKQQLLISNNIAKAKHAPMLDAHVERSSSPGYLNSSSWDSGTMPYGVVLHSLRSPAGKMLPRGRYVACRPPLISMPHRHCSPCARDRGDEAAGGPWSVGDDGDVNYGVGAARVGGGARSATDLCERVVRKLECGGMAGRLKSSLGAVSGIEDAMGSDMGPTHWGTKRGGRTE